MEGSSTYEWVLRETNVLGQPDLWERYDGTRPTYVLSSRDLPSPTGADVRFRNGPVVEHLTEIRTAAGEGHTWVVGGGDVAGQFLDADALDEMVLTVAPVSLGAGAALLPRRVESDRLVLTKVFQRGQFADLHYSVTRNSH